MARVRGVTNRPVAAQALTHVLRIERPLRRPQTGNFVEIRVNFPGGVNQLAYRSFCYIITPAPPSGLASAAAPYR